MTLSKELAFEIMQLTTDPNDIYGIMKQSDWDPSVCVRGIDSMSSGSIIIVMRNTDWDSEVYKVGIQRLKFGHCRTKKLLNQYS